MAYISATRDRGIEPEKQKEPNESYIKIGDRVSLSGSAIAERSRYIDQQNLPAPTFESRGRQYRDVPITDEYRSDAGITAAVWEDITPEDPTFAMLDQQYEYHSPKKLPRKKVLSQNLQQAIHECHRTCSFVSRNTLRSCDQP